MNRLLVLAIAFQFPAASLAKADNSAPPSLQEFKRESITRMLNENARAGDPSHPAPSDILSRADYAAQVRIAQILSSIEAIFELKFYSYETFISPTGPILANELGCRIITSGASGVRRADGKLNGYRTALDCEKYILDVSEYDYSQPLDHKVHIILPDEVANIDIGPGRAIARYYTNDNKSLMASFTWSNDKHVVRIHAVGEQQPNAQSWNIEVTDVARRAVRDKIEN